MAWVETRITRTTQPQDFCGIDWSNPITWGLVSAWLPNTMPVGATYSAEPVYEPTSVGNSRLFDGKFVETGQTLGNAVTLLTLVSVKSFNADSSLAHTNTVPTSRNGIVIWFNSSALGLQIRQDSDSLLHNLSFSSVNLSNPSAIAVKWEKGKYASLFLNGRGVTSNNAVSWADSFPLRLFAGNRDSYWQNANIRGGMYAVFNRALSDAEIKSLSDNPWQLYEPEVQRIWVDDGASVTLPTLVQPTVTTSAGAWTATGAATLHDAINELVASDTQYISVNSASTTEMLLGEAAFPGGANQTLAYRASSTQSSTFTITLKQGATQIMTRTHALTGIDTLYTHALTPGEISLITAGPISALMTPS